MSAFKEDNNQNILVATDVAARGLDVKGVDLVINYELPGDSENYVHRIGRTGRADSKGKAYSLVSEKDVDSLSRIQDYLKKKLEVFWLEDDEIVKEFKALSSDHDLRSAKKRQYKDQNNKKTTGSSGKKKSKRSGSRKPYEKSERTSGEKKSGKERPYNKKRRNKKSSHRKDENSSEGKRDFSKKKKGPHKSSRRPNKKLAKGQKRVYSSRGRAAAPKTVGQKVSQFFKNLFK